MKTVLCIGILICFSCNLSFRKEDERRNALNSMMQTDADFSESAATNGFRKAFLDFMDEDGTLLRNNRNLIMGGDAIKYISSINDSTFKLEWESRGGDVAKSGDMGYTFGIYTLYNDTAEQKGTYVTIWRKQENGKWKFVVDASTQGLEDLIEE
jgi:ketosteroid isomerase-like protein